MTENGKKNGKRVDWDGWKGSEVEGVITEFLDKFEEGEVVEFDVETAFKILNTIYTDKEQIEKWRALMDKKPQYVLKDVLGGYIIQLATRKWQTRYVSADVEKGLIRIGKPVAEQKRRGRKKAEVSQVDEQKLETQTEQEPETQEEQGAEHPLANIEVELPEAVEIPDVEVNI